MKQTWLNLLEAVLLFAALFLTLPYLPSNEMDRLPLLPSAAFAVILFAGSRGLRWRGRYVVIAAELAAFALFAWTANAAANMLHAG